MSYKNRLHYTSWGQKRKYLISKVKKYLRQEALTSSELGQLPKQDLMNLIHLLLRKYHNNLSLLQSLLHTSRHVVIGLLIGYLSLSSTACKNKVNPNIPLKNSIALSYQSGETISTQANQEYNPQLLYENVLNLVETL